ncbi:MAG: histidine ammonia-lyase [Ignavibacteriales bacterium]|nr:histidine ammonia-lyase [Ignavibacteriales bacterium]
MKTITLDGNSLTIPELSQVAYDGVSVTLSKKALSRINAARKLVEGWIQSGEIVYGVTTGFGEFSNVRIDRQNLEELQQNLIFSHAAGAGDSLPIEVVRAMMALRVNALAKGHSGIRKETLQLLVEMLNKDMVPVIPSQGSVGASGDLVQLAHLVLAMMGKGRVWDNGEARWKDSGHNRILASSVALGKAKLKPVRLSAKEGLALINGTQMMTAYAALAVHQAKELCKTADIAAGISVEALRGSDTPFDERIHKLRPYLGQQASARNLRRLMYKSEIRDSHRYGDSRVQDAYSLRCIPQVHGASRDAVDYVYDKVTTEINSANDNPLIFPGEDVHLEGGNFHGQPMALAMDFLAIALSELANISERRTERLVNGSLNGLPKFLTTQGGLNSGLMIAQYTAASLVSENKVLCHPASVDSIPTSANQEDHNSMGSISAQKAWKVLRNAQTVLAIELMCACQGLEFARHYNSERPMKSGKGIEAAFAAVRRQVQHLDRDRVLYDDIQNALRLVVGSSVLRAVENTIGSLD